MISTQSVETKLGKIVKGFTKTITDLGRLTEQIDGQVTSNSQEMQSLAAENRTLESQKKKVDKISRNLRNLMGDDEDEKQ